MNMRQSLTQEGVKINEADFEAEYNFKQRNTTEKVIMESASQVIATTPEQKKIMHEKYGISEDKIAIIPPGFFPEKYRKIDESEIKKVHEKYNLPPRFIVTVGRIASNKGYDLLIKAFKYVVQEVPDVKLVFTIGSNEPSDVKKREELLQIANGLGLADNVKLFGYINELEVFYNAAEILVMPSTYEPFGMVAIEGMACGTPAVVTSLGGLKDFLVEGQDALFVNPLDTQEMAQTIVKLLKDKRLQAKIARKGYEKAHSTFTWEKIAKSTLGVIPQ
jgi:mannosylfructose-phosphate synthase